MYLWNPLDLPLNILMVEMWAVGLYSNLSKSPLKKAPHVVLHEEKQDTESYITILGSF